MNEMVGAPYMFLQERRFYKPSRDARVLAILDSLSQESALSQNELGRRLHLSGAMVNQYLKELQDGNLIRYVAVNGKSYRYVLTDAGESQRRQMFSGLSTETIQIYTALKQLIASKLDSLKRRGLSKLALFGASETCEVVLSSLREGFFEIVTLIDNDPAKQGKIFNGYVISPPHVLEAVHCQAVLITSFARQDEIYQQLEPLRRRKGLEVVKL